jgi:hypothetical protein
MPFPHLGDGLRLSRVPKKLKDRSRGPRTVYKQKPRVPSDGRIRSSGLVWENRDTAPHVQVFTNPMI